MSLTYNEKRELLNKAIAEAKSDRVWVIDFTDEYLIYDNDSKYFKMGYALLDGEVTLGEEVEVERHVDYVKVQAALRLSGALDKGEKDSGFKWRVRVVEFGTDKNGTHWTREPLVAALPLFEGATVFQLTEAQHQAKPHPAGKPTTEIVGWLSNPAADDKGIVADLNILKTADKLRDNLVDSWERKKPDLLGLSLDLKGAAEKRTIAGKKVLYLLAVKNVTVDVVYAPAAGGKFLRMAAAQRDGLNQEEVVVMDKLLAALKEKRPEAYETLKAKIEDKTVTEDEIIELLAADKKIDLDGLDEQIKASVKAALEDAQAKKEPSGKEPEGSGDDDAILKAAKILEETRIVACGISLEKTLTASKLPEEAQEKLKEQFSEKVFEDADLKAAIQREKEYLDKLLGSGTVRDSGGVVITEDSRDKAIQMVDDFFDGKVMSFKAAYINLTGDKDVTGQLKGASRLTASIESTTFAEILGDSVTRKMLKAYKESNLQGWRRIVDVVPLGDFRTNRRTRMGGYADLPVVPQGDPYGALTTPGDEEATYTPTKKGGTEDITLEAIKDDDVGAIRKIPQKLSRTAARTLYKFVFDFLRTNPTIYDATALFTAGHGNLGAAALDSAGLTARRQAMIKQTEADSAEGLGIPPRYLVTSVDLDKTGYDLIAAPRNSDFDPTTPDFTRTVQLEQIVVNYWTDANNWFLVADPLDIPTIEIGFLDGKEAPELFVQDMPNVGSMFSNDKLTYKIRHVYGGAVMDYRGLDGSIVA